MDFTKIIIVITEEVILIWTLYKQCVIENMYIEVFTLFCFNATTPNICIVFGKATHIKILGLAVRVLELWV